MNVPMNERVVLKDLVSAQKGEVANRTLAVGQATACLMALAPGEEIGTHSAPANALVLALEGSCHFTVGDRKHRVQVGESLQMPAGVPHSLKTDEGFKMMLLLVKE